jgi:uncharacterized repeat protein (TIGR01451 family)
MRIKLKKAFQLIAIIVIGILMVATVVSFARNSAEQVKAMGAIPPSEGGYPKLSLSTKTVNPTLAGTDGQVLTYQIEIINTGAYTASNATLVDPIPENTVYKTGTAVSSKLPAPVFTTTMQYPNGAILWKGEVGFDKSVVIAFGVTVTKGFEGDILNTAVISDPMITEPVSVTAETSVTDSPLFEISKTSTPKLPGSNHPLTYTLTVKNVGQLAENVPILVSDVVPSSTTFRSVGQDGEVNETNDVVTWIRDVTLDFGETTSFTFSVKVSDVPSGTVIENQDYFVQGAGDVKEGSPYTTTVIDPILILSKSVDPDPPGSSREMTYTLTALNLGSLATGVQITDTVPASVTLRRVGDGGTSQQVGDKTVITWDIGSLDTRQSKQVSYTVFVPDIADVIVWNKDYGICSAEGVCAAGITTPSYITGPTFEVTAAVNPIAHKPGQGSDPFQKVTPILTIKNLGPGNAIGATARLMFGRISVSNLDVLQVIPQEGTQPGSLFIGPPCNTAYPCNGYSWVGDLNVGDMITITTNAGQNTIGGDEGTPYTATVVITDALNGYVTEPITATAIGHVTHMSNLLPTKLAPLAIGPGQAMTYTINVFNSGLSAEYNAILTDTLPEGVSLVPGSISDGGKSFEDQGQTVISWTLPVDFLGVGESLSRSFRVLADPALVSGTLIINDQYQTSVYESYLKGIKVVNGEPVTTTVHEVGLIDSYKEVTPTWALPATDTVLTWIVHVVNSGPIDLSGVQVNDIFPWQHSTYQRDAQVSGGAGSLNDDIVSLEWIGDVAKYSEQVITFTTIVDDFYEGVLTNTATISHSSLQQPVEVTAVAYITDKPVLHISKVATPDPVEGNGGILTYKIEVTNLGQQATLLTMSDTIPANTSYIFGSGSSGAKLEDDTLKWTLPGLDQGATLNMAFQVVVNGGWRVVNDQYSVSCREGVAAYGEPVITDIYYRYPKIFLPIIYK